MSKLRISDVFFNGRKESKKIGGQAVIEGVMMRGESACAVAVRKSDKSIEVLKIDIKPESSRHKILRLPVIRGVISFADSLYTGMKTLMKSAEAAGIDLQEEQPSKFEIWLTAKFGEKKILSFMMYLSVVIAILLSVGLFMALPVFIGQLFLPLFNESPQGEAWGLSVIEGFVRILIFMIYILLISRYKDIQRVFEYHGAEHKTINCYESNEELTVENVRKYPRLHKRCGTSFLFIVMIISMVVFLFVRTDSFALRLLSRVLLVPFIAGVSYEFLKFAGRSNSRFIFFLSCPGLALQKATTNEPDDSQIETAIAAMNYVIETERELLNQNPETESAP